MGIFWKKWLIDWGIVFFFLIGPSINSKHKQHEKNYFTSYIGFWVQPG